MDGTSTAAPAPASAPAVAAARQLPDNGADAGSDVVASKGGEMASEGMNRRGTSRAAKTGGVSSAAAANGNGYAATATAAAAVRGSRPSSHAKHTNNGETEEGVEGVSGNGVPSGAGVRAPDAGIGHAVEVAPPRAGKDTMAKDEGEEEGEREEVVARRKGVRHRAVDAGEPLPPATGAASEATASAATGAADAAVVFIEDAAGEERAFLSPSSLSFKTDRELSRRKLIAENGNGNGVNDNDNGNGNSIGNGNGNGSRKTKKRGKRDNESGLSEGTKVCLTGGGGHGEGGRGMAWGIVGRVFKRVCFTGIGTTVR